MRKTPPGKLLESAHSVEREFQNVEPRQRRALYREISKALASIHFADVNAIGLQSYGKPNDYCKRQVERWAKQYLVSTGEGKSKKNPRMLELIDWLRQHIPLEDSSGAAAGLVHGDFRIDNLVFHPTEDRVIGVLDWELSTLGNQMCDVAYSCLHYIGRSTVPDGVPSLAEYLAYYCAATGKQWPASQWKFYVAFSLFRGASILAGVHCRWILGNASGGERARSAGKQADSFIDVAWQFIDSESVLPLHPPHESIPQEHVQQVGEESGGTLHSSGGRFVPSHKVQNLRDRLIKFMEDHIYPMENEFAKLAQSSMRWSVHPQEERLKELAKKEGLWNFWIPFDSAARVKQVILGESRDGHANKAFDELLGPGLSNLEYGYLCEILGRSVWAPQVFNCGAPDTGNMEVLMRYGNADQIRQWLVPLLEGNIRSAFAMTEPQVASSDATNIECSIARDGDSYVINGRKWWTSGAMDPRCKILIVMGKTDFTGPKHKQQSMILVDMNAPGVIVKRPLTVFGFDDAPHGHAELLFENVRVPAKNILLGEGRGFEIAQGRLGPGRLHHCMRSIGAAERGMQIMIQRATSRRAFDKLIAQHGSFLSELAKCRIEVERTRLLVLEAADQLDRLGNRKARGTIAMAKVAAPSMALKVLDMAIQVHGGAGVSGDTVLAHLWAATRTLRIADGPDEVHLGTITLLELRKAKL